MYEQDFCRCFLKEHICSSPAAETVFSFTRVITVMTPALRTTPLHFSTAHAGKQSRHQSQRDLLGPDTQLTGD